MDRSDVTACFTSLDGSKSIVEPNCSQPKGAVRLNRLIGSADIVIGNYNPGTMRKCGFSDNDLTDLSQGLLYYSITGILDRLYSEFPAFNMIFQALSRTMIITGQTDVPPAHPDIPIGDICAGMYALIGTASALSVRDKHNGQRILVPMFGELVSLFIERAGRTFATGEAGWLVIAIRNERSWERVSEAIERPNLTAFCRLKLTLTGSKAGIFCAAPCKKLLNPFQ